MKRSEITMKHLSVLYWLKLLNDMEVEDAETLGQKYFLISVDSIGLYQSEFDNIVTELVEMEFLTETQGEEYILDFTSDGMKMAGVLEKLEALRALGFKSVKAIYDFMVEHKEDIKDILVALIPEVISWGMKL